MRTGSRSGQPIVTLPPHSEEGQGPLPKQYGGAVPLVFGTGRVPGKVLWIGTVTYAPDVQIRDTSVTPPSWKPGPGKVAPAVIGLCEGPLTGGGVLRVWRGGDSFASVDWLTRPAGSGVATTVLPGDGTEGTWSLQTSLTTRDDSYSVQGPNSKPYTVPDPASVSADLGVKRVVGMAFQPMTLVASNPAVGQYTYAAGVYGFAVLDVAVKIITVRRNLTALPGWLYPMTYANTAQIRFDALAVSDGSLPDDQYEVIGPCATIPDPRGAGYTTGTDCQPADVLLDLLTDPRRGLGWPVSQVEVDYGPDGATASGYRTWCTAMSFAVSRAIVERVGTSRLVQELLDATHARAVWSEGKLKIIPLGETAVGSYAPAPIVATIGGDDFVVSRGSDPIQMTQVQASETFTVFPITFSDRNASYSDVTVEVPLDDPFVSASAAYTGYEQPAKVRRADARSMPWVSTPWHAASLSWLLGMRSLYVRNTFRFTLGPRWARLEPGDLLALTDTVLGLDAQQVRITSIEERDSGELEIYAEEAPFSTATPPALTVQTNDGLSSVSPAPVQTVPGGRIDDGTVGASQITPMSWTAITPATGMSAGAGLAYSRDARGYVNLRGAVTSNGTSAFICGITYSNVLPAGFRPSQFRVFPVSSPTGAQSAVIVDGNGQIYLTSIPANGTTWYLDTVAYLAEQ